MRVITKWSKELPEDFSVRVHELIHRDEAEACHDPQYRPIQPLSRDGALRIRGGTEKDYLTYRKCTPLGLCQYQRSGK